MDKGFGKFGKSEERILILYSCNSFLSPQLLITPFFRCLSQSLTFSLLSSSHVLYSAPLPSPPSYSTPPLPHTLLLPSPPTYMYCPSPHVLNPSPVIPHALLLSSPPSLHTLFPLCLSFPPHYLSPTFAHPFPQLIS